MLCLLSPNPDVQAWASPQPPSTSPLGKPTASIIVYGTPPQIEISLPLVFFSLIYYEPFGQRSSLDKHWASRPSSGFITYQEPPDTFVQHRSRLLSMDRGDCNEDSEFTLCYYSQDGFSYCLLLRAYTTASVEWRGCQQVVQSKQTDELLFPLFFLIN